MANQLFSAYARVGDARALASVIGEDELSASDKAFMKFGELFENNFIKQGTDENRTIDDTLELAWDLLCVLPRAELDRLSAELLDKFYKPERADKYLSGVVNKADL